MWDQVKPITLFLEQKNNDASRFLLYFYSYDHKSVKLNEASHITSAGELLGSFCKLLEPYRNSEYSARFFIEKLNKETTQKMIEYYENSNLFIEYPI